MAMRMRWTPPQGEPLPQKSLAEKPDWSPDTLISYFYFGNIFAVRTEACQEIPWLGAVISGRICMISA